MPKSTAGVRRQCPHCHEFFHPASRHFKKCIFLPLVFGATEKAPPSNFDPFAELLETFPDNLLLWRIVASECDRET